MNDLQDILKAEIARKGLIPFARFMEVALYCPIFGYYEQEDVSPGQGGDFYTSVSVGEMFGELLANQFSEWKQAGACGTPNGQWQLVEAGAHHGRLAGDILRWLRQEREELFASLEYWILEPSPLRRLVQQENLAEFADSVRWFESWQDVPASGVNGIIFSNELLDAMPVHRIGWDASKKEWFEFGVMWDENHFAWAKIPRSASGFLKSALRTPHSALPQALLDVLPDGFTTEICPAALDWWREAGKALKAGKLMTIDYGLKAEQFFTPERKDGTLRAYHHHHLSNDLLVNPGEQDLTAHVNFTAIQLAGEEEGLKTELFTTQRTFLTHIIEKNCCHNPTVKEWTSSRVRQFQTLTHPEHLGQKFHVLVQGKESNSLRPAGELSD